HLQLAPEDLRMLGHGQAVAGHVGGRPKPDGAADGVDDVPGLLRQLGKRHRLDPLRLAVDLSLARGDRGRVVPTPRDKTRRTHLSPRPVGARPQAAAMILAPWRRSRPDYLRTRRNAWLLSNLAIRQWPSASRRQSMRTSA